MLEQCALRTSVPWNVGLFSADPSQTLVLLVDIKADLDKVWPLLLQSLEPLHRRGWLSATRNGDMTVGPVTVVATGKAQTLNAPAVMAAGR